MTAKTKRQDLQIIRSLIENWEWETQSTPDWLNNLLTIALRIDEHNQKFLNDNFTPLSFNIRQKLIEVQQSLG